MGFKAKRSGSIFGISAAKEKLKTITQIAIMLDENKIKEAHPLLEKAVKKYPHEEGLWEMLGHVGTELGLSTVMQRAFAKLVQFQPKDPDLWHNLAVVYGMESYLALSARIFQEFVRRFPADERKDSALETIALAEEQIKEMLASYNIPNDEAGMKLAVLHDKAQLFMSQQEFEKSIEAARELIKKAPDFIAPYNNLSLVYFMQGDMVKAVETAKLALEKQPDNFHALGNFVRFSAFLGKKDEARNYADKFRLAESVFPENYTKKIETFALFGDDETVVEIYKEIEKKKIQVSKEGYTKNLAAFSFYLLGNEKKAEKLWKEALEDDSDEAAENLAELKLPRYERNVFALGLNYWIPPAYLKELMKLTEDIKDDENFDTALTAKTNRFFNKYPHLIGIFPSVLERADQFAKDFVIKIITWSKNPQALEILKEFALGKSGSDSLRRSAAFALRELNALPKTVNLWVQGKQIETRFMGYNIVLEPTYETLYPMKPAAKEFLVKGIEAVHDKNIKLATEYYQKALEIQPNHPVLLNNSMMLRELKGEKFDMQKETEKLHQQFPDYFYSGVTLGRLELRDGNIQRAKELSIKYEERDEWHLDEFKMWSKLQIEICLEEKLFDGARSWLEQMKSAEEDMLEADEINEKEYEELQTSIEQAEIYDQLRKSLSGLIGKTKRKKK